jgi:hypothetical protein
VPPFPWLHENAQWSDILVLAAALTWLAEQRRQELRAPTLAEVLLGVFVLLAGVSWVVAPAGYGGTFGDFIGASELAVIAYLTSRFAADRWAFALIVRVVAVTSLLVVGAAILGLALFYADVETELAGAYGVLGTRRGLRPCTGWAGAPGGPWQLLHLRLRGDRPGRRHAAPKAETRCQVALALAVVLTFSRAIIGFILADPHRRHAAQAYGCGSGSVGVHRCDGGAHLRRYPERSVLPARQHGPPAPKESGADLFD